MKPEYIEKIKELILDHKGKWFPEKEIKPVWEKYLEYRGEEIPTEDERGLFYIVWIATESRRYYENQKKVTG